MRRYTVTAKDPKDEAAARAAQVVIDAMPDHIARAILDVAVDASATGVVDVERLRSVMQDYFKHDDPQAPDP